jgi:hypothetical protein
MPLDPGPGRERFYERILLGAGHGTNLKLLTNNCTQQGLSMVGTLIVHCHSLTKSIPTKRFPAFPE